VARGRLRNRQPDRAGTGEKTKAPAQQLAVDEPDRPRPAYSSAQALLFAWVVFLIALILYGWTLAPTVTLVDSGELIVVARFLGVAHPPGFPLWTMLAHVATLMPWGDIASRVNFASAFFGALAAGTATLVVAELGIVASYIASSKRLVAQRNLRHEKRKRSNDPAEESKRDSSMQRLLILVPAIGVGLLLTFSRTLWSYSTIAEVYSLNTLLILLILFLMIRWRRCILADRRGASAGATAPITRHDIFLYIAAVVFGLALGVHHVTVALILPALAVIVYRTEGLRFFRSTRLLYAGIVSVAALVAVYAYLPLAASREPIISWGSPRSLQEIWWHVTGRQYQVFFVSSLQEMGEQFLEFGRMVFREFGFPWIPAALFLAITGFVELFKRDRTTFWFLLLIFVPDLLYSISYSIAEDKDAYYLPAFVSLAIAAGFGVRWLIGKILSKSQTTPRVYLLAALPVFVTAAIALTGNWPFNNRRHFFIASDYVKNIFSTIQPNGLLLTSDWQVASPMLYAQEVEGRRRDVKVVDVKLTRRLWYFDYLKRAYPDMIERSRNQVDAFVANLTEWERDPEKFARDPALTRKINDSFQEMYHAIVNNERKVAPVYITGDLPFSDRREPELTTWINQNFQPVAQGLVFRLETDPAFHDSPDVQLQFRGLADGSLRFEKDDVVSLKILPVYSSMMVNRGRYLARFNQHERAVAAFKQALAIKPDYDLAQQGLQESSKRLGKP
jgi:hypothetical protein